MKRLLSIVAVLCLLVTLVGCSGEGTSTATGDLRDYNAFIIEFKDLVSKVPDYNIQQLSDVPLDDDVIAHIFHIKDTIFDETYRLQVNTNAGGKITWVCLDKERGSRAELQFAVFSLYAYESMDFPTVDADAFYAKYDLFSTENIFESDVCGAYKITSMSMESNYITFSIKC